VYFDSFPQLDGWPHNSELVLHVVPVIIPIFYKLSQLRFCLILYLEESVFALDVSCSSHKKLQLFEISMCSIVSIVLLNHDGCEFEALRSFKHLLGV